jgi:hypothetical protein
VNNRLGHERVKNANRLVDESKLPTDETAEDPGRSGFAGTRKRGNNGIENEGAIFAERFARSSSEEFQTERDPDEPPDGQPRTAGCSGVNGFTTGEGERA